MRTFDIEYDEVARRRVYTMAKALVTGVPKSEPDILDRYWVPKCENDKRLMDIVNETLPSDRPTLEKLGINPNPRIVVEYAEAVAALYRGSN
jgi:hypothetical protein